MPLSEHEQRLLDEMERNLYGRDADVVSAPEGRTHRTNYRAIVVGLVLAVLGLGSLVAGVITHTMLVGIGGFVLMFVGVLVTTRPGEPVDPLAELGLGSQAGSRAKTAKSSKPRLTFMQRMERQWDERADPRP